MESKKSFDHVYRRIYKDLRERARSYVSSSAEDFILYQKAQTKDAKRPFDPSSLEELHDSIEKSKITYLGDIHTFDQNTRNLERIFKSIVEKNSNFALGIEFIENNKQNYIDQYLNHHITEMEFLDAIEYSESWKFPWIHYRIFFDIAKKNKLPILALNSEGKLSDRDEFAAGKIAQYLNKNPSKKLFIFFGEYHIVQDKLPLLVSKKISSSISQTIIHQNLDEVFWKLHEKKNAFEFSILQFGQNEFCLQTSPPWIKYESIIYWFESFMEDVEFDIHEYLIETGFKLLNSSVSENLVYLCNQIIDALQIEGISKGEIEDFNLHDHQGLSTILQQLSLNEWAPIKNFYHQLILESKVFSIPPSVFYCPSYSINRMAYIAGLHIYNKIFKLDNLWSKRLQESSQEDRFLYFFNRSLFAYFCSKIINPYKKCDRYLDIKSKEKVRLNDHVNRTIALNILERKFSLPRCLKGAKLIHVYSSAQVIAHYIAEVIFDSMLNEDVEDHLPQLEFQALFKSLPRSPHDITSLLDKALPLEAMLNEKKRFF